MVRALVQARETAIVSARLCPVTIVVSSCASPSPPSSVHRLLLSLPDSSALCAVSLFPRRAAVAMRWLSLAALALVLLLCSLASAQAEDLGTDLDTVSTPQLLHPVLLRHADSSDASEEPAYDTIEPEYSDEPSQETTLVEESSTQVRGGGKTRWTNLPPLERDSAGCMRRCGSLASPVAAVAAHSSHHAIVAIQGVHEIGGGECSTQSSTEAGARSGFDSLRSDHGRTHSCFSLSRAHCLSLPGQRPSRPLPRGDSHGGTRTSATVAMQTGAQLVAAQMRVLIHTPSQPLLLPSPPLAPPSRPPSGSSRGSMALYCFSSHAPAIVCRVLLAASLSHESLPFFSLGESSIFGLALEHECLQATA